MSIIDTALAAVNPYLIWIKVGALMIALASAAGASWYVTHNIDAAKLEAVELADSKAQTANISASLTQLQGFIATMHSADADYNSKLDAINAQFANLKQELSNATHTPLPADCKPDAGRLRVLSDAVSAANASPAAGK